MASARLIRDTWAPEPFPTVLTCVPSTTTPTTLPDFAVRLADALGLEFRDMVERVGTRRPQRVMENSAQQLRNVLDAFAVRDVPVGEPVLLVDDVVDSRWTLTVVGVALRDAGSGPVHPFVLAKAVSD